MQKLVYVAVVLVSSTGMSMAQKSEKSKAVVIPNEIYLVSIAAQPDCPIRIEKAVMAKMLDGTERPFYEARNIGNKPITFYQVDAVGSDGGGISAIWPYKRTQVSVLPGEISPSNINDGSVEFVPLTEELKNKLKLNTGKLSAIVVFMVVKVEFQDGTTYDVTHLVDNLEEYVRKLQEASVNAREDPSVPRKRRP